MKKYGSLHKRAVTLLLTAGLICTMTACGTSSVTQSSSTAVPASQTGLTDAWEPDPDKTYNYTWCFYQMEPLAEQPYMFDFYKDNFNVTFDVWDMESTQANEIIANRIIGGDIPDRFEVADTATMQKYAEQGVIAEIPMEMLEKYAPDLLACYDYDLPGVLDYCKVDGKIYGLPKYSMGSIARAPVVIRKDWLENVGITKVPETLDEFEEMLYAFTFDDPDGDGKDNTYGISSSGLMAVYGAYGYIPYVDSQGAPFGGAWTDKDGQLVFGAVQPEMKEALGRIAKWYQDGVVDPEFVTGENQGGYWALSHAFINQRIGVSGMAQTYHWQPVTVEGGKPGTDLEELLKVNPDAEIEIIDPPLGPDGARGMYANNPMNSSKIVFGIDLQNNPDKMAKLLTVINWLYQSRDNFNVAANGIEGVHWEYQDLTSTWDGKVEQTVVMIPPYDAPNTANVNFAHTAMSVCTPSFGQLEDGVEEGVSKRWARSVNADKYRIYNELLVPLPSETIYKADLDSLVLETYYSIISGAQSVDSFDDFVQQWNSLGGEQLTKEANEWYSSVKG